MTEHEQTIKQTLDQVRPVLGRIGEGIDAKELTGQERMNALLAIGAAMLTMTVDIYRLAGGAEYAASCLYAAADDLVGDKNEGDGE